MTLSLDIPREEALERAADIVIRAWTSFDRARETEPPIDDRLRELLESALPEGPTSALEVLEDARRGPRRVDRADTAALLRLRRLVRARDRRASATCWPRASTPTSRSGRRRRPRSSDQAVRWVAELSASRPARGPSRAAARLEHDGARGRARARAARARGGGASAAPPRRSTARTRRTTRSTRAAEILGLGSDERALARRSTASGGCGPDASPRRSAPTARPASCPSPSSRPPARR